MLVSAEARAAIPSLKDIKSGDPKPVTHRVFVDPAKSIEELCREAGFVLDLPSAMLGEWPTGPFNHDDKGKEKTNGTKSPYLVEVTDGSDTVGESVESAIKGRGKDFSNSTIHEGVVLARDHPEILDSRRLVVTATSHGSFNVIQIGKRGDEVVVSPLFFGDTNTDWVSYSGKDEKGNDKKVNGVAIKERKVATNLPFAVIFAKSRTPQVPGM